MASSDYITLISDDGFSFIVQRSSACISPVIKNMLDPTSEYPPEIGSMEALLTLRRGFCGGSFEYLPA
jgi:hypothetical protein